MDEDSEEAKFRKACPCAAGESSSESSSESSKLGSSGNCPCAEGYDLVEADLRKMRRITQRIAGMVEKIDKNQQWMDTAESALESLERQIKKVKETRGDLKTELDALKDVKLKLKKSMTADQIERDLREATKSYGKVAAGAEMSEERKAALADAEKKLADKVAGLQKRLKAATDWIKDIKALPAP